MPKSFLPAGGKRVACAECYKGTSILWYWHLPPPSFPQCLGYVPRQTSAAAAAYPFASSTLYSCPRKRGAACSTCQNCARKCPAICDLWRNHWCVDKCKRLGAGRRAQAAPSSPTVNHFCVCCMSGFSPCSSRLLCLSVLPDLVLI